MKIVAVILAAGASERMGSPKALLRLGAETFLDRLIRIFADFCESEVVVLGTDAERIRTGIERGRQVTFVSNPDPARGQLSSLQCGLASLPEDMDAVLFTPVDYAGIDGATVGTLLDAFAGSRSVVAIPRFEGRHGHPVLVSTALLAEFLALPATATARDVIHAHAARTSYADVEDPAVVLDADTPEEHERLRKLVEDR